ncbi:MAG TPA: hypothetical protein VJP77_02905 [Planctomycetota bacterium]|nr:hypothetical protein [Planctomycetota bacterium]
MPDAPATAPVTPLEASLRTTWNARVVPYDRERFPFAERIADEVRRLGHAIPALDRLHEVVPRERVYALSKELCAATHRPEFRRLVADFVRAEIVPRGELVAPIAVQRFLNVRIMLPDRPQAVFPFHTGLLYGHGPAARSLWLPLTDVTRPEDRSASLQIVDLEPSRALTRMAVEQALSVEQMTELFGRESRGVQAGPGTVLFFTQEHIHGNFVNETGRTRVSIDFRVAEARFGEQLARKIPGGYFEILRDEDVVADVDADVDSDAGADDAAPRNERPYVLYLNNNTSGTRQVPAHLQRYMVQEYCERRGLAFEFELFELETMDHLPTLRHLVEVLACNAVLYSIYALPEDPAERAAIFAGARARGVHLHFANEALAVADEAGVGRVEALLAFAKYGQRGG